MTVMLLETPGPGEKLPTSLFFATTAIDSPSITCAVTPLSNVTGAKP
jgi:hypothetical protein